MLAPPGHLILVKWSKTLQSVDGSLALPIPEVPGYPADLIAAYQNLLASSLTSSPNHQLLSFYKDNVLDMVTVSMLTKALSVMLDALRLDSAMFSLHTL